MYGTVCVNSIRASKTLTDEYNANSKHLIFVHFVMFRRSV